MNTTADAGLTPGQLIQQQLERRGWSQRTLSAVLGIGESSVTRILSGKQAVDADLAVALETVLDLAAEQLLHLQTSRELASARAACGADSGRAARARLYGELPLREMIRRGWIDVPDVRDTVNVDAALAGLFGVACIGEIDRLASNGGPDSLGRLAWLARVRQLGGRITASSYSQQTAAGVLASLRLLMGSVGAIADVPPLLAEYGIRLVVLDELPRAQIEAACLWPDHSAPIVALSLSDDRIDRFWFLLRHQLEHVLKLETCALPRSHCDETERDADAVATSFCMPLSHVDAFIARKAPFISRGDMKAFARERGVHPGIVAGLVQRRTGRYEGFNSLIARVRPVLASYRGG